MIRIPMLGCTFSCFAIFEVLETATLPEWDDEEEIAPDAHELVQELYGIWDSLNQNKMLEAWHDAQQIREEATGRARNYRNIYRQAT